MTRISRGLLVCLCLVAMPSHSATLPDKKTLINANGVTQFDAKEGKVKITIALTTHEMDIGSVIVPVDKRQNNCTYSRKPCVVIDDLDINVNGHALSVPRSAYGTLTDVSEAQVKKSWGNEFVLSLHGGTANDSYTADIVFEVNRVTRKTITNNTGTQVVERTSWPIVGR